MSSGVEPLPGREAERRDNDAEQGRGGEGERRNDGGEGSRGGGARRDIDPEALLVALVLVPHSYPRNRFFGLYESRGARRARRRAALLRSIAGDVAEGASALSVQRQEGQICVSYRLDELGVSRSCLLDEDELALLQLVVERRGHDSSALSIADADPRVRERVQERLLRLL